MRECGLPGSAGPNTSPASRWSRAFNGADSRCVHPFVIFSGFYRGHGLVYTNKMWANDRDALRPYGVREKMARHMCLASDVVEKSRCVAPKHLSSSTIAILTLEIDTLYTLQERRSYHWQMPRRDDLVEVVHRTRLLRFEPKNLRQHESSTYNKGRRVRQPQVHHRFPIIITLRNYAGGETKPPRSEPARDSGCIAKRVKKSRCGKSQFKTI